MPSHPFKGVFLDLDNCLYSYDSCHVPAHEAVLALLVKKIGRPAKDISTPLATSRQDVKRATGDTASSHSRLLYFQKTVETLLKKTDLSLTQKLHDLYWSTYFSHMTLYPGVREFLSFLKSRHIRVAFVTDQAADLQMKKLLHLGLETSFDFLVTSEEAGHDKPHPSIFQLALQKLNLTPQDVLMIGDEPEKDVTGAKRLGIIGVLVTPTLFTDGTLTNYFT